jgi:hypothetical protein
MNRIVREHYPVADLPENLREGFADEAEVRVIVETQHAKPGNALSLDELFALRKPPFRTAEEIVEEVQRQRDDWDD